MKTQSTVSGLCDALNRVCHADVGNDWFSICFLQGGPESGGIFVRAMLPNGSAEIDGRVQVGM